VNTLIQIDKHFIVTGNSYLVKDDLPKVGAKWDGRARVWRLRANRTHELLAMCEEKKVNALKSMRTARRSAVRHRESGGLLNPFFDENKKGRCQEPTPTRKEAGNSAEQPTRELRRRQSSCLR